jgi:hypothetical protein
VPPENILYSRQYPINEYISIEIPTVGEILGCENEYYSIVSVIASTPADMMVQLDDAGIDFSQINDYELFIFAFGLLKERDASLIFGELDLTQFNHAINQENGAVVLRNEETGAVID